MRQSFSRSRLLARTCVLAAVAVATPVEATPISGLLSLSSGAVSISSAGMTGTFEGGTGLGVVLTGSLANTADLVFAAPALANFVTFQAAPTLGLNLTGVAASAYSGAACFAPAAAGQTCSPGGALAGLNFMNTPSGAVASLTVEGELTNGVTANPTTGIYTFQFAGQSYQQVLATVLGGGSVASTYSAEFASAATGTTFSTGGSLSLSGAGLDFSPTAKVGALFPGQASIASPLTGTFVPLQFTLAQLANLSFAAAPIDVLVSLMHFLTFQADPTLTGELTTVTGGAFGSAECFVPAAVGQTCRFPSVPLLFSNVAGGSLAALSLSGLFHDGPDSDAFQGLLSLQFAGMTYQQVLALLVTGQSVTALYSASFVTDRAALTPAAVPEPATLVLVGLGLALAVASRRRAARI